MSDPRFSSAQEDVINALRTGGPSTIQALTSLTGRNRNSVYKAIRSLSYFGYIRAVGVERHRTKDATVWEVVQ